MDAYYTAIKLPHTYMLLGMGYNKISCYDYHESSDHDSWYYHNIT